MTSSSLSAPARFSPAPPQKPPTGLRPATLNGTGKSFRYLAALLSGIAIVAGTLASHADPPPPTPAPPPPPPIARRWTVFAECQMVTVPQKAMLALVSEFGDDATSGAAWDEVQKMVESGEATLAADLVTKGAHGQKLTAVTAEEMRYATEFQPQSLPDKIPQENAVEFLKAWPLVGATPTAFETRNVGETLEITATVSDDGKWFDAEVVPQHVRFLHWQKIDAGKLPSGEHLSIEQPYFHSMRDTLSVRLRNDQRALLGVHKVPDAEKMFELFLLRVAATRSPGEQ